MEKGASFAGPLANIGVPELEVPPVGDTLESRPEDPAVYGGGNSQLPIGTEVELLPGGRWRVVEKSKG